MSQNPDEIRQNIEHTRERIEDTVEALAYKTDFKSRAKDAVDEKIDAVKTAVNSAIGIVRHGAGKATDQANGMMKEVTSKDNMNAMRDNIDSVRGNLVNAGSQMGTQVGTNMNKAVGIMQDNPLGFAFGALALGFIVGSILPTTRIEREKIGSMSDQMADTAKAKAEEMIEQGKAAVGQVVTQTLTGGSSQWEGANLSGSTSTNASSSATGVSSGSGMSQSATSPSSSSTKPDYNQGSAYRETSVINGIGSSA